MEELLLRGVSQLFEDSVVVRVERVSRRIRDVDHVNAKSCLYNNFEGVHPRPLKTLRYKTYIIPVHDQGTSE